MLDPTFSEALKIVFSCTVFTAEVCVTTVFLHNKSVCHIYLRLAVEAGLAVHEVWCEVTLASFWVVHFLSPYIKVSLTIGFVDIVHAFFRTTSSYAGSSQVELIVIAICSGVFVSNKRCHARCLLTKTRDRFPEDIQPDPRSFLGLRWW